ncbi:MAG: LysM peptidoglycan-binding domain-containing protein, partial [Cyanobacteria bacterium HKST-UBA02]|nr:LysM peptidoglycan-binding domain-containing protein [Cyanobacteria bacterium HKST-UBA02]
MAQDKQSDASEPVRDDTGKRAESLTPRDRSATLQEKSEAEKGNNKESLSDMELKALSPENPRTSELAANRFEIVDDSKASPDENNEISTSYAEGMKAIHQKAATPAEAREKGEKFDRFYNLRKEAELLAQTEGSADLTVLRRESELPEEPESIDRIEPEGDPRDEFKTVTVQRGDTLWGIVRTHLGEHAAGSEIKQMVDTVARDNKLVNPDLIYPGQVLTLRDQTRPKKSGEPERSEKSEKSGEPERNETPSVPEEMDESSEPLNLPEARPRHEKLIEIASKQGIATDQFKHDLELIEDRVKNDRITALEAEQSFKHLERLLTTESEAGLTLEDRQILAQQVVAQMAVPTRTDQGQFNTCNVTTVECRLYSRHPSMPARMVTDLALTGKYTAGDGTNVKIDVGAIQDEARKVPVPDGYRSYASQLFQVCAVNVHYIKEGLGTRYEQLEPKWGENNDNGERLYASDGMLLGKTPGLTAEPIIEIHNAITGEPHDRDFFIGSIAEPGVCLVNSQSDLEHLLKHANDTHSFPVILAVHTANQPFWCDSGSGSAGGAGGNSGGWHVVTITDYNPGPPTVATIDNQWGKAADHNDLLMAIETKDLFRASLGPKDAIPELQKESKELRDKGTPDAGLEFDLLRLRNLTGELGGSDYDRELKALFKEHRARWLKGDADMTEEFKGITMLPMALNLMSPGDDKLLFLSELEQEKVITHREFYDYMVAEAVSGITTGKPMTPVFERLKA